jgi:DNA invertase Pin-like site-specific DNA recombinase
MRRAVFYLRVSTIDQTTANQERELREIAARMGCEVVRVYKDRGISGAKGRDKRQHSMRCAETRPSANSTWLWPGR